LLDGKNGGANRQIDLAVTCRAIYLLNTYRLGHA
jgi:hypothetical protein